MLNGDDVVEDKTGKQIIRPVPAAKFMYDFDFKRRINRPWRYMGSSDDLTEFDAEIKKAEGRFGLYRIVLARTGHVVRTNETKRTMW